MAEMTNGRPQDGNVPGVTTFSINSTALQVESVDLGALELENCADAFEIKLQIWGVLTFWAFLCDTLPTEEAQIQTYAKHAPSVGLGYSGLPVNFPPSLPIPPGVTGKYLCVMTEDSNSFTGGKVVVNLLRNKPNAELLAAGTHYIKH